MRFLSRLKKPFEWGSNAASAWGLLPATVQTAATAMLAGATGYFGLLEVGIAQAIFYASGVFAFGMTTIYLSLRISQILGQFQRLSIPQIGISSASMDKKPNSDEIEHLNMFFILRNESQRPMFYKLRRTQHNLGQRSPIADGVDESIVIIPATGGIQQVNLPTIQKVPLGKKVGDQPVPAPAGTIEVDVDYGPASDELDFHLHYKATIQVAITQPLGSKEKRAELMSSLKILKHTKI
jgi:hypothetical protein